MKISILKNSEDRSLALNLFQWFTSEFSDQVEVTHFRDSSKSEYRPTILKFTATEVLVQTASPAKHVTRIELGFEPKSNVDIELLSKKVRNFLKETCRLTEQDFTFESGYASKLSM